jgi:hypothetical protein
MISPTSPSSRSAPARWKTGLVILAGVSLMMASFKVQAAEPTESGGELSGSDGEQPKAGQQYHLQASDPDQPQDPAVVAARKKAALEAELAKKNPQAAPEPAFYQKWQFWALAGAVTVGVVGAIIGGAAIYHQIRGGDAAKCSMDFIGCFGEGR